MMYDPIALANNIKTFRQALGLSQGDLAARLSVSTQSVSKWECGNSVPDISNLCALSELLSVSVDTLLGNSPTQKKMYIGVDGGGSKTEFVSFDQNGILLDRLVLGPCNPNAIGVSATVSLLCTGIDRLCANRAELGGVYVGSAGFLLGDNARDIRAALKKSYPHVKIKCNTDILNVVAGCTDEENCLAVICGTGSTVCVKEGEALTRLTGWGYLLSKSGSGFDIGRDALFAALEHREGLGEATAITDLVEKRIGHSVIDDIHRIYAEGQSYVASFAPAVIQAYEQGDAVAGTILENNAHRLAHVINHACRSYNCGTTIVLAGGLVTAESPFLHILRPLLPSDMNILLPKMPQVMGACVMCARLCNLETAPLIAQFAKQYDGFKTRA